MFCPLCGNEIDESTQFCPQCGNPLNDDAAAAIASLAPGSPVRTSDMELTSDPTVQAQPLPASSSEQATQVQTTPAPAPAQTPYKHTPEAPAKRSKARIVVPVLLLLALVGAGVYFAWNMFFAPRNDASFSVQIRADGLDEGSSPLPIRVKGTTESNTPISQIYMLDPLVTELELPLGNYTISCAGSPVRSDGTIFEPPTESYELTYQLATATEASQEPGPDTTSQESSTNHYVALISKDGAELKEASFELVPIPAEEVTDTQIDAIRTWMEEAQLDNPNSYLDKVREARQARLSQLEEEQAAAEAERKAKEEAAKAKEEAEKAAAQEEASKRKEAMEQALASNPTGLTINERDLAAQNLTYTGVLSKFEIPDAVANPEIVGQPNYFLELPADVDLTLVLASGESVPLATNEVGVHIGYSEDLESHLGETVSISGHFVFSRKAIYLLPINIEADTITNY